MAKRKILVVDDEPDILEITQKKLKENDYDCIAASRGKEVCGLCQTYMPDLVLLDIAMPDMNGYQICEEIRNTPKTKNIPILFLSGKELLSEGILERCKNLGVHGYLPKPSTLQELLNKIKEILDSTAPKE